MTRFPALLLGLALAASAAAQPTPPVPPTPPAPPVFSADALDALFDRPPRVEVNLRGALLRLAAQASSDDPDTARLLHDLRGVTVRVYALDAARADLGGHLTRLGDAFAGHGWEPLVRVRADDDGQDDVWVYVRAGATLLEGLAVAAVDSDEGTVSFVHIDGLIDPASVSDLGSRFGGVDLDAIDRDVEREMRDIEREMRDAERDVEREMRDVDVQAEVEAALRAAEDAREDARIAREEALEEARMAREAALEEARVAREQARAEREAARAERDRSRAEAEAARKRAARP